MLDLAKMDENMTPEQEEQTDIPCKIPDIIPNNNSKDSPIEISSENKSEEEWMDIIGNGQLMKKIIKKGKKNHEPENGDICVLNIVGKLEDGTIAENYVNMSIQLGDFEVVQGLDLTIRLMKEGEIAEIPLHPRFAYGTRGNGCIPPDTTVIYTVELKEIICRPELEHLSVKERKEIGNKKRERGNWWFIRKDFCVAVECYERALEYLNLDKWYKCEEPVSDAELQDLLNDRVKVQNNLTAALIEMYAYNSALEHVNEVLKYQPNNAKALFRKGKILKGMGEYSKAFLCFQGALKIEPEMKALQIELIGLKEKISEECEKEKCLYAKMLGIKKDRLSKNIKVEDKNKIAKGILWTLLGASAAVVGILVHRFIS